MSFVCSYIIYYKDGETEECVLHRGTKEECEKIYALCSPVVYSGVRPVDHTELVVVEEPA